MIHAIFMRFIEIDDSLALIKIKLEDMVIKCGYKNYAEKYKF